VGRAFACLASPQRPSARFLAFYLLFFFPRFAARFKRGSGAASQAQYSSAAELKARLTELQVPHQDCLDKVTPTLHAKNRCSLPRCLRVSLMPLHAKAGGTPMLPRGGKHLLSFYLPRTRARPDATP
jgi:hypothetical protein